MNALVYRAAEDPLPSDRSVERDDGGRVMAGWALVATLVRPVIVEVPGVVVEDCHGVPFVVGEVLSVHHPDMLMVEFASHEQGMANSGRPETGEFAAFLAGISDSALTFRNLDVLREEDL